MSDSIRQMTGTITPVCRLLSTKEAAKAVGLSEYTLRLGYKQGIYPAMLIGNRDSQVRRLRWNLEALQEAIANEIRTVDVG